MKFLHGLVLYSVFFHGHAHGARILQSKTFGDYAAVVKWEEGRDGESLVIMKHGTIVHREGEAGDHFWIGNHFDDSLDKKDPHSGKDLTGNGVPDLIITRWNGGAHCCNFLSVFELDTKGLKKLITIDGGSYGFKIKDLDRDGIPEISFWDWPIDYLFNSFAHSAQGRVILGFRNGHYRVASPLMYRRRPKDRVLSIAKAEIRKSFEGMGDLVPYELLELAMRLSYSGYKELALRIAEETWPKDRDDLKSFKLKFKGALSGSVYWSEFNSGSPSHW